MSASGHLPPPLILFDYKRVPATVVEALPKGWSYGSNDSGWMSNDTFFQYIKNIFYPSLIENNIQFPVIVYVDGHSSHLTLSLCEFCKEHNIIIIALFPNSTHFLQPCDISLFRPLKGEFQKEVHKWETNNTEPFAKKYFGKVLKTATDNLDLKKIMENGFKKCGLFPFNVEAIDYANVIKIRTDEENQSYEKNYERQSCKEACSTSTINEYLISLKNLEKYIPMKVLEEFNRNELLDTRYKFLYEYWLKLKRLCGSY